MGSSSRTRSRGLTGRPDRRAAGEIARPQELLARHGAGEQEALDEVDARGLDRDELVGVLDALRDGPGLEPAHHAGERVEDDLPVGVVPARRPPGSGRACRCRVGRRGSSCSSTGRGPRRRGRWRRRPRAAPSSARRKPGTSRGGACSTISTTSRSADSARLAGVVRGGSPGSPGRGPGSRRGRSGRGGARRGARCASPGRRRRRPGRWPPRRACAARTRRAPPGARRWCPRGPRIRHSRPKSCGLVGPDLEDGLEDDREPPGLEELIEEGGLGWHGLRFCTGHATGPGPRAGRAWRYIQVNETT